MPNLSVEQLRKEATRLAFEAGKANASIGPDSDKRRLALARLYDLCRLIDVLIQAGEEH